MGLGWETYVVELMNEKLGIEDGMQSECPIRPSIYSKILIPVTGNLSMR